MIHRTHQATHVVNHAKMLGVSVSVKTSDSARKGHVLEYIILAPVAVSGPFVQKYFHSTGHVNIMQKDQIRSVLTLQNDAFLSTEHTRTSFDHRGKLSQLTNFEPNTFEEKQARSGAQKNDHFCSAEIIISGGRRNSLPCSAPICGGICP